MNIIKKAKCKSCGYEWLPRTNNPVECPNCKTRKWNKKQNKKTG